MSAKKPMIVLSFDGLSEMDLEFLKSQPGFESFMARASGCKSVATVYPSITYAAHASIVTGCWPKNHGIYDNTLLMPFSKSPDWYWRHSALQRETFYDLARKKGYRVATLLWPTTAKGEIDYNMPEIFANRPYHHQIFVSMTNGTPGFQLRMNGRYGHLRRGKKQPELDTFTHQVLLDTLRTQQPELVLCHYTDVDSMRHETGYDSVEAKEGLLRHDKRLSEVMALMASLPKYHEATLVVLGDHGSLNADHVLSPNAFLKTLCWLKPSKWAGGHYKAIAKSCDGSAYIYGKDLSAVEIEILKGNLEQFATYTKGIERIYDQVELSAEGADPNALFMLEAKIGYLFEDTDDTPYVMPLEAHPLFKGQAVTAVHGYHPEKQNYRTVFMLAGTCVKENCWIEHMRLIDIAPTLAPLLGIQMPEIDGIPYPLILKEIADEETH